jgi:hypothetical protein
MKERLALGYERFATWLWYDSGAKPLGLALTAAVWFWLALSHC